MRVCVVGAGYVGLVTGACLASLGHEVVLVESDAHKLRALRSGTVPIFEPGLPDIFSRAVKKKLLRFARRVKDGLRLPSGRVQVVFIAVGTPPRPDGSADLSAVEHVTEEISRHMEDDLVIAEKSTVPVETCHWVKQTVERWNKKRVPYDVVSNPEFLSEGSAVEDFLKPDRVVIGSSSKRAEKLMRELYAPLAAPILVVDPKSAELIKHASNSFLAAKISFINAVAELCEKTGADVAEVARGMGLDRRIGHQFLRPGIGFGGFCFPKDLEAFHWIAKKKGYDFALLKAVQSINEHQKGWVARQVEARLWNLEGKTVGLLGLSFKPKTDDLRFAPSLEIASALRSRGVRVQAHDPVAMPKARALKEFKGVKFCRGPYDCARGADALAIITEWAEYAELDLKRIAGLMRNPLLLDGRNLLDPGKARRAGLSYVGVGRPDQPESRGP